MVGCCGVYYNGLVGEVLVDLNGYSPCPLNPDASVLKPKPTKIRESEQDICESEQDIREIEDRSKLPVRRPRRHVSPLFNIEKIIEEELAAFKDKEDQDNKALEDKLMYGDEDEENKMMDSSSDECDEGFYDR